MKKEKKEKKSETATGRRTARRVERVSVQCGAVGPEVGVVPLVDVFHQGVFSGLRRVVVVVIHKKPGVVRLHQQSQQIQRRTQHKEISLRQRKEQPGTQSYSQRKGGSV